MDHHDANLSDVIVVLTDEMNVTTDQAVAQLKALGLAVDDVDNNNGVVGGTIVSEKVKSLQTLPFVKYVRRVFDYTADYPPDDPRNLDKDDDQDLPDVDDAGS